MESVEGDDLHVPVTVLILIFAFIDYLIQLFRLHGRKTNHEFWTLNFEGYVSFSVNKKLRIFLLFFLPHRNVLGLSYVFLVAEDEFLHV